MKTKTKNRWIDWTIIACIVLFAGILGMIGKCTNDTVHAKEVCKVWDIQPPILCEEEISYDSAYFISQFELLQMCKNGTAVLWMWNGMDNPYKKKSWIPVSSYSPEHTIIHFDCFIKNKVSACNKFTDIIDEIVECKKRNGEWK